MQVVSASAARFIAADARAEADGTPSPTGAKTPLTLLVAGRAGNLAIVDWGTHVLSSDLPQSTVITADIDLDARVRAFDGGDGSLVRLAAEI